MQQFADEGTRVASAAQMDCGHHVEDSRTIAVDHHAAAGYRLFAVVQHEKMSRQRDANDALGLGLRHLDLAVQAGGDVSDDAA